MDAGKTLLICEDDPVQLQLLTTAFVQAGYRAVIGRSPAEAVRKANLESIDVVLSDVQLECGSAFDLIRELRRSGSDLPVLLASAYVTPALQERAQASGAIRLLEKSGAVLDLVRNVDAAIQKWFQNRKAGRILLIDDHGPSRAVEAAILKEAAFDVVQVETGQGALDVLTSASAPLDLVVLDLTVTGPTGADLVRRIRAIDRSVGIVVLGGSVSQEEIVAAYAAGAAGMVRKPFSEERFLQVVRTQVTVARRARATAERAVQPATSWRGRLARGARHLIKHRSFLTAALSSVVMAMGILVIVAFSPTLNSSNVPELGSLEDRIIDEMRRFNEGYKKELRWNGIER